MATIAAVTAEVSPSRTGRSAASRAELHRLLQPWARADSLRGYLSFAIDIGLYALGVAAVMLAPPLAAKLAGGLLAGIALVGLGSLSHEAAHRAVVRSKRANKVLAVLSLTMIQFNYRLWVYDHHVRHHGKTNVKYNNFLSPLTRDEYLARSPFRRAIYRAYHSPTGLGILLYFLLERWPTIHFVPGAYLPKAMRASAWRYAALQVVWGGLLVAALAMVAHARGEGIAAAVLCGFVLPAVIWFAAFSTTAFLQHTNPRLRWYRSTSLVASTPDMLSVHVRVPAWMNHITHYVLEHPIHHITAMVPHYHLKQAQAALAGFVDPPVIEMDLSFGNLSDALRRCKLYDYERHVWTDFAGNVTGIPDETALAREAAGRLPYVEDGSAGIFFPGEAAAEPEPGLVEKTGAR